MSLPDTLASILATRGVQGVVVASADGFVIEAAHEGNGGGNDDRTAGLVAAVLASARSLAERFGDGDLTQVTIEFERGPVLLLPLPEPAADYVALAILTDASALGRARLALRRAATELARGVSE